MQLFGWGVCLPKALAESKNQVLAFSSFSVTLLRLNVYLSSHTWYQTFSNQQLLQSHHIFTCYSMQQHGSSSLISCEKQTIRIEFQPCKVNLNTRRGEALHPHTHQPSALAYNASLTPTAVVTALVPTITGMGDHVSGRVRRAICGQVHSGTRLTDLPYFSAYV
jgi:hypothetical protein